MARLGRPPVEAVRIRRKEEWELRRQGWSFEKIGERFGLSASTVRRDMTDQRRILGMDMPPQPTPPPRRRLIVQGCFALARALGMRDEDDEDGDEAADWEGIDEALREAIEQYARTVRGCIEDEIAMARERKTERNEPEQMEMEYEDRGVSVPRQQEIPYAPIKAPHGFVLPAAINFLADLLKDGPCRTLVISKEGIARGYSKRTLTRARQALGVVTFFEGGQSWQALSDDDDSAEQHVQQQEEPPAEPLTDAEREWEEQRDEALAILRGED